MNVARLDSYFIVVFPMIHRNTFDGTSLFHLLKSWGFEKILKAISENNSFLTIIELSKP